MDRTVKVFSMKDAPSTTQYWRERSPAERLAALEQIRREYHLWKYGHEPRLQRVVSIARQK